MVRFWIGFNKMAAKMAKPFKNRTFFVGFLNGLNKMAANYGSHLVFSI
jgi:hypothetical protein